MTIESLIDIDTRMADSIDCNGILGKANFKEIFIELNKQVEGAVRNFLVEETTVDVPKTIEKILKFLEEVSITQTLEEAMGLLYKVLKLSLKSVKEGVFQEFGSKLIKTVGAVLNIAIRAHRVKQINS